jgi:hypothetical protein
MQHDTAVRLARAFAPWIQELDGSARLEHAAPANASPRDFGQILEGQAQSERCIADGHRPLHRQRSQQIEYGPRQRRNPLTLDVAHVSRSQWGHMKMDIAAYFSSARPIAGDVDSCELVVPDGELVQHSGGHVADGRVDRRLTQSCCNQTTMLLASLE